MQNSYDPTIKKMTIRGATSFPPEILEYAEEIEILDMSFGTMETLPEEIAQLTNLQVAFFSNNSFKEVPEVLARCQNLQMVGFKSCKISKVSETCLPPSLRDLILTDNQIRELPKSIGGLPNLQKLMLTGNKLESLPKELLNCQKIEKLRLSANKFTRLPEWLLELPKLAWYVDSGNPTSFNTATLPPFKTITQDEVTLGQKIGESAMNVVYAGTYNGKDVAVKVYGDALTSDGLPADEINACLVTGLHENIIGAIGKLDMPDGRQALVMPLVPAHFTTLGQPPDFESCTRDTYAPDTAFSLSFTKKCLTDVASALRHMHSQGVMHGDMYAHNILADEHGNSYLGDFGAASLYDRSDPRRERIDVGAFGYLMDELLSRTTETSGALERLHTLKATCLNSDVSQRPAFDTICRILSS